ncbi:MAG TPA: NAD(P)/FAD-dependent oxidoreductase [Solirubrobacteraceae bacterium]|jgi:dihydrolipoamide dehydrogenase|nr:NAD(P)/FAD-dependent oxidoreductase [Solirubrobacteraceae bacterium]
MTEHDVIVIGAGPAGEVCAGRAAGDGLDVALVERELVGGECAYWACMPSKALLRPAQLLAEVKRVPGVTQAVAGALDPAAVLARRDEVIHDLDDAAQLPWVEDRGITLYRGQARLEGERRVRVGDEVLEARRAIVIAVGSGAAIPPVPGLREIAPWTNRQGTTAKVVPQRLTVLGGGAVGCELAQAWASLGAAVTLVEAEPGLLPGEEPFAGEELAAALDDYGVDVKVGNQATEAQRSQAGTFTLTLDTGEVVASDELLVAVGRTPHTGDLGLETVDLEPGATIAVDDHMRVTVPGHGGWLYAIGDVNGRALLTHAGKYQAMVAVANIMNREATAQWDGELAPRVVFTDPQVAAVGQTLRQALDDGLPARAVDAELGRTPGASFIGKGAPSACRIVVDERREVMIGATFTGPEVAESLHAATFAIVGEVPLTRLVHAMPAFPTRSEVWLRLLDPWTP